MDKCKINQDINRLQYNDRVILSLLKTNLPKANKYYFVVESKDDERFYLNANIIGLDFKLKDIINDIIFDFSNKDYACQSNDKIKLDVTGKDWVLSVFNFIKNDGKRFFSYDDLNKLIFIVDKDYSLKLSSSKVSLDSEYEKYISITKPYAIENYFFEDSNLYKVFNHIYADKPELLNEKYQSFCKELSDAISQVYKLYNCNGCYTFISNQIYSNDLKNEFNFLFYSSGNAEKNYFVLNDDDISIEVNKYENSINNIVDRYYALDYYELASEFERFEDSCNDDEHKTHRFIKGHDLIDFLKEFLSKEYKEYDFHFKRQLHEFSSLIDVDIDLYNVNGDKIN